MIQMERKANVSLGVNISNDLKGSNYAGVRLSFYPKPEKFTRVDDKKRRVLSKQIAVTSKDNPVIADVIKGIDKTRDIAELDEDIETEIVGKFLKDSANILLDWDNNFVYKYTEKEYISSPDGKLIERDAKVFEPNVNVDKNPLRSWVIEDDKGQLLSKFKGLQIAYEKKEIVKKFVFKSSYQLTHIDNLTFDFLYNIAKKLSDNNIMVLVSSLKDGKSIAPLIFKRGGTTYQGFLEGRIKGAEYCLILHITELEMKPIPVESA